MQQNRNRKILFGEDGNALMGLITFNIIFFISLNLIFVIFNLSKVDVGAQNSFRSNILSWVMVPGSGEKIFTRPWVLLTYMFTHVDVWRMVGNMFALWSFGFIMQDITGNRHLAPLYLYGGFFGGLVFLFLVNIFPIFHSDLQALFLMGAGPSIMAIALATTTLAPDYRLFPMINKGIPIWVLTLIFVIINTATMAGTKGSLAIANFGGGLMGFLYIKLLKSGHDLSTWMHQFSYWFLHMFHPKKQTEVRPMKQEVFYETKGPTFTKTANVTQQRIDEILDKINNSGYHFLTDAEKEYLKRASKDL